MICNVSLAASLTHSQCNHFAPLCIQYKTMNQEKAQKATGNISDHTRKFTQERLSRRVCLAVTKNNTLSNEVVNKRTHREESIETEGRNCSIGKEKEETRTAKTLDDIKSWMKVVNIVMLHDGQICSASMMAIYGNPVA